MNIKVIMLIALSLCMSGCWGYKAPRGPVIAHAAPRPALIGHIVFVQLSDPTKINALQRDADLMLGTIPSVTTFACGPHLDAGRATVSDDYDIAIYLGFESQEELAAYVDHPQHVQFVERWKPHLKSLRVYDMIDLPDAQTQVGYCGIGGRKKFLGIF